jgi:hypothetical protein
MNLLLEFTGALIYFVLSIVLSPLFLLLNIFLALYSASKQFNTWYLKQMQQIKRRHYRMPSMEIFSERKWFTWKTR